MQIAIPGNVVNLKRNDIHIRVTIDKQEAYYDTEYIIIITSADSVLETNRDCIL